MEPSRLLAIETLRASIACHRGEAHQLRNIAIGSPSPAVRLWANSDLEKLEQRIQAQADELENLEAEELDPR